jgi:hypothetical protein
MTSVACAETAGRGGLAAPQQCLSPPRDILRARPFLTAFLALSGWATYNVGRKKPEQEQTAAGPRLRVGLVGLDLRLGSDQAPAKVL